MVFILLLTLQSILTLVIPEATSLNWRERRMLSWSDFKAQPVDAAPNAALTSTSILIDFKFDHSTVSYHLDCVFHPEKSWTKVASDNILGHEQGHFDISQVFTRKLYQALNAYKPRPGSIDKDIKNIYQRIASLQSQYQVLYDQETNYSRNRQQQEIWEEKIGRELTVLAEYANYP